MSKLRWCLLIGAVAVLLLLPLIIYAGFFWWHWSEDPQNWAAYGTYISGTVGVLVSALGLMALIVTLQLQRKNNQFLANAYAINELKGHVYQFLSRLDGIVSNTDIRNKRTGQIIHVGRDAFRFYYKKLRAIYAKEQSSSAEGNERQVVRESFRVLYARHGSDFGHYFRTLYRCIKVIDQSTVDDESKKNLVLLVTAGLSKFELLMLFYNGLSPLGERRFPALIEKYGLLEHCDADGLLSLVHTNFYGASAYGEGNEQKGPEVIKLL